jgi:hypothetical protein
LQHGDIFQHGKQRRSAEMLMRRLPILNIMASARAVDPHWHALPWDAPRA